MTIIAGHFDRLSPPGTWVVGFTPAPALWETMDQSLSQAINGDGGGTYAPSGPIIIGGSGLELPFGSVWTVLSGGSLNVNGGITVQSNGNITFLNGAHALFNSGSNVGISAGSVWIGTLTSASGCLVDLDTACLQIVDSGATAPSGFPYVTARERSIVQPPIIASTSSSSFVPTLLGFQDNGASGIYTWTFSKVVSGAKINSISMGYQAVGGTPPTSNNATIGLYKTNAANGITTQIGTTFVVGTVPSSGISYATITGLTEVIDDSQCTYFLLIHASAGGGAQPLSWSAPQVVMTNITQMGQT